MTTIDWIIIAAYLVGMILFSVFLGKGQEDQDDYYVGGRNLPWWAVGISTMATQTSVISFMSIPAFVALRPGGGLTWLQYELAVPLAMVAIMFFLIPFFRNLELVSIYEYLELRFGPSVRYLLSSVFLVSRGIGTGVGVYASAIALNVALEQSIVWTIVIIGVVTIIYDTIGGMKAVVYSDVIQMFILVGGIFLCIYIGVDRAGGLGEVFTSMDPERWQALAMDTGFNYKDGDAIPFWAFLIGGFFLYASYYGADQSQVQRELSAPTTDDTKKSLIFNGLMRFPLTCLYIFMGIALGAAFLKLPELQAAVPPDKLDALVPFFILQELPTGLRAILFAAMLAAAMSSLDSALNSLSASTMQDFIERGREFTAEQTLKIGKITTVIWGFILIGIALLVNQFKGIGTVIEVINKVGAAFYGPILAAFIMGVASKRVNATGTLMGTLGGVIYNIYLWQFQPQIHWMWWNAFGFFVAAGITYIVSLMTAPPPPEKVDNYTLNAAAFAEEKKWLPGYALLVGYFIFMMMVLTYVPTFFS